MAFFASKVAQSQPQLFANPADAFYRCARTDDDLSVTPSHPHRLDVGIKAVKC